MNAARGIRSSPSPLPILALALCLVPGGVPGAAQDIPPAHPASGRALPPAYFQRIRERPDFFRVKGGWIQRSAEAREGAGSVTGTLAMAVILAHFADSSDPVVTDREVQAAMFDGPSPYGTLSEYYAEVSGGRLRVEGETFPWVRSGLAMAQVVGSQWGLGDDARIGEFFSEALEVVDASVDFGRFDNDGPDGIPNSGDDDGQVDAVAFQFQEIAASCGGPSIWPHRSRLQYMREDGQPYTTDDLRPDGTFIVVNDYTTQGATDCSGTRVQTATTVAHELGHVLGLPDLYDRSQGVPAESRRWVVGCWSLMAAGAWGCGTDDRAEWVRPTHMGAWEKMQLGWLDEVEEVGALVDGELELEPVLHHSRVLKIPLQPGVSEAQGGEYLLLEYRTREGFDRDLPASGVLIYHVDPKIPGNQPCDACPQQYRVSLLEADGNNTLRRNFGEGGNRGEAGDAWGVTGPGSLAANSYPSTRIHSGNRSGVTIYRISLDGAVAHLTLSTRAVSPASLLRNWLGLSSAAPLTPEEEVYLDRHGNGNGGYDVGDLRAYWMR